MKEPAGGRNSAEDGDPRRQALDGVLHQIERCYGRGSILKMGDTSSMNVETTSTGNLVPVTGDLVMIIFELCVAVTCLSSL